MGEGTARWCLPVAAEITECSDHIRPPPETHVARLERGDVGGVVRPQMEVVRVPAGDGWYSEISVLGVAT